MNQSNKISLVTDLKKRILRLTKRRVQCLRPFYNEGNCSFSYSISDGSPSSKINLTSTATCILLLEKLKELEEIGCSKKSISDNLLNTKWKTANLGEYNCYTVGILLPALKLLGADPSNEKIQKGLNALKKAIKTGSGGISLFPKHQGTESAFLTYWGLKSLTKFSSAFSAEMEIQKAIAWAEQEVYRQIAYFNSKGAPLKNVYQLAFAWAICETFSNNQRLCRQVSDHVISLIFKDQQVNGVWEQYYPLFNFPDTGSAFVYYFELLLAIIWTIEKNPKVLEPYLENIEKVLSWTENTAIKYNRNLIGWSIMTDPKVRLKPVSWATMQILYVFDRISEYLSEIHRDYIFLAAGGYSITTSKKEKQFEDIVDIKVKIDGKEESVKNILNATIIEPIVSADKTLKNRIPNNISFSTIFFGPPGTSKTTLARTISNKLDWPILELDTSHFAPRQNVGLEMRIVEVFSLLEQLYNTVIFLDEIDELVRERSDSSSSTGTRLLTNIMLPRLNKLRELGRSIFIVATNHIEVFNDAAKRFGRFDMVLPIGPPEVDGKLKSLASRLNLSYEEVKPWWEQDIGGKERLTFENLLFIEIGILIRAMGGQTNSESFHSALKKIEKNIYLKDEKLENFQKNCIDYARLP